MEGQHLVPLEQFLLLFEQAEHALIEEAGRVADRWRSAARIGVGLAGAALAAGDEVHGGPGGGGPGGADAEEFEEVRVHQISVREGSLSGGVAASAWSPAASGAGGLSAGRALSSGGAAA